MEYKDLILEKREHIATMTLNRPDRLNALSPNLVEEIIAAVEELKGDDDIRVLIITGAGRGFCSGADLSASAEGALLMSKSSRKERLTPLHRFGKLGACLPNFDKPVIGAINGPAVGAGFAFALGCDIRIASELASFSAIFIRRALVPDTGISYLLPRIVGISRACELVLTGDIIDAREADRIGLVSRVVPHDQLMSTARELALKLAKNAPITSQLAKRGIYRSLANNLTSQLDYEAWSHDLVESTEDREEGVRAFLEKREPEFKGY